MSKKVPFSLEIGSEVRLIDTWQNRPFCSAEHEEQNRPANEVYHKDGPAQRANFWTMVHTTLRFFRPGKSPRSWEPAVAEICSMLEISRSTFFRYVKRSGKAPGT